MKINKYDWIVYINTYRCIMCGFDGIELNDEYCNICKEPIEWIDNTILKESKK